jgi:Immunoglobulin-like domain of bacterial spore germination
MARLGAGFALVVLLLSAGCGGAPTPTNRSTTTLTVFRIRSGRLHAERAEVPAVRSTPAAALGALGLLVPVSVADGTARVGGTLSPQQLAEVVYTLTSLPAVRRVSVAGRAALTRADVAAYVPPILILSPADGQAVPSTFTVRGTASVFEATLVVELRRGTTVVERRTVTATAGAPARGSFATTLHAGANGPATVVAFAPSAADGRPQHTQRVPVTIEG